MNNPACGWISSEDPNKIVSNLITGGDVACTVWIDPLPPYATVKSIDVRFPWPGDRSPQTYTVGVKPDGPGGSTTPIGSFVHSQPPTPERCEPPYVPLPVQTVTGIVYPNGVPGYTYGAANQLVFSDSIDMEFIDIILTFKRAPKVEFDLTDATPEQERRVLIRQGRADSPYFSSAQATLPEAAPGRDQRIRIAGTLRDEDGPVPNRMVYLRTVDPPDVAPYVPVASRRQNDNVAGPGTLASTTVTTDASGRFETVLTVTSFASGDNYQIEGSVVPAFGNRTACDDTNVCSKSGVLTAWKRVFLEVGRMFKRGAYLSVSAQAGDSVVVVDDIAPFHPGMRIALLHGPQTRTAPPAPELEYALEEATIDADGVEAAASGPGGRLHLTAPLPRGFDGIDGAAGRPSGIADFVGILTGNDSQDFFEPNVTYLQSLFADAFVDYVIFPAQPAPYVQAIQEDLAAMQPADELHSYVLRWFRYYGLPGHQYLLGSREGSSAVNQKRGTTRALNGISYSHVMVRRFLGALSTAASRRLLGEGTAHEVAHQWQTNRWSSHTANGSHCNDFRYYDDSSKYCLMHSTYGSLPEFFDDIVRFHYVTDTFGVDSEYRWIRERCEPNPALAMSGPSDWWKQPASPCR